MAGESSTYDPEKPGRSPAAEPPFAYLLRESRQGYRPDRLLTCSYLPDTTILAVNQVTANFFGIPEQDFIGTSLLAAVPEASRDELRDMVRHILATGEPRSIIHDVERRPGDVRVMQWINIPVKDAEGVVVRIEGIGTDITDIRNLEREARRRDRLLEAVADAGRLLITASDPFAFVEEALGYIATAMDVQRAYLFDNLRDPETGDLCMRQRFRWCAEGFPSGADDPTFQHMPYQTFHDVYDALSQGRVFTSITSQRPPHEQPFLKQYRIHSAMLVPILVEQEWWGFLGFDDCLTERQWNAGEIGVLRTAASLIGGVIGRSEAMADLHERESRYRNLYQLMRLMADNTPDMIWAKDRGGRFLFTNVAMSRRFLGVDNPNETVGRSDRSFREEDPQARELWEETEREVMRRRVTLKTKEVREHNGETRIYDVSKSPLLDERGELIGIVGSARDITDARHLEDQVRQAQKMEAIGLLAGGIAHDFNNLLMVVINGIELARRRSEISVESLAHLRDAQSAARGACALTRRLLTFARQQPSERTPHDLRTVLTHLDPLLRRLVHEGIALTIDPGDTPLIAEIDPNQIDQLVMNLAINARDAMPEGGQLEIRLDRVDMSSEAQSRFLDREAQPASGPHARLRVRDTGSGIDPGIRDQVFTPFFSTKEPGQGTGLGLSIVYGIAKQHHARIALDSAPGRGSVFEVYIPLTDKKLGSTQSMKSASGPPALCGARVLVVEDHAKVGEISEAMLRELGLAAASAGGEQEAIKILGHDKEPFSLVLTDLFMPDGSGERLIGYLREHYPDLPVILMTGQSDRIDHISLDTHPRLALLDKPFTLNELEAALTRLLG